MKYKMKKIILNLTIIIFTVITYSQSDVYSYTENGTINRIIIDKNYFVMASYKVDTNKFVKTIGGFYSENGNKLNVDLEFNSNYKNDSISKIEIEKKANWKKISLKENDLQGKWLMVGRVRNGNEQRRNLDRPRKTMKFLINGYFQWIAFNTETFQFSGSGGGKYITKDGKYIESIEYFSRDDSKVGLNLEFDYELINKEWNHKGFSSKGDPLHEIWVVRK